MVATGLEQPVLVDQAVAVQDTTVAQVKDQPAQEFTAKDIQAVTATMVAVQQVTYLHNQVFVSMVEAVEAVLANKDLKENHTIQKPKVEMEWHLLSKELLRLIMEQVVAAELMDLLETMVEIQQ